MGLRVAFAWGVCLATILLLVVLRQAGLLSPNKSTAVGAVAGLLLGAAFGGPDFQPLGPTVATIAIMTLAIALTLRFMTPVVLWKP